VRRYRGLVLERRAEEAIQLLSEELEFVLPEVTIGVEEVFQALTGPTPQFDHLLQEMVDAGLHELPDGRLLSETDEVYRWKETAEVSNTEHRAMLWTVENGKIRHMKFFLEREQAWAEAGVDRG
jgi:hypothetical protein